MDRLDKIQFLNDPDTREALGRLRHGMVQQEMISRNVRRGLWDIGFVVCGLGKVELTPKGRRFASVFK